MKNEEKNLVQLAFNGSSKTPKPKFWVPDPSLLTSKCKKGSAAATDHIISPMLVKMSHQRWTFVGLNAWREVKVDETQWMGRLVSADEGVHCFCVFSQNKPFICTQQPLPKRYQMIVQIIGSVPVIRESWFHFAFKTCFLQGDFFSFFRQLFRIFSSQIIRTHVDLKL